MKSKKLFLIITSTILFGLNALASNITIGTPGAGGGGTAVSGTWTTGSTVTVYDHMIIPVGESLTIQPGVNVIIADTAIKVELIALGNFYCLGTASNPVNITVQPSLIPAGNPFPGCWGGIICDTTCTEFLMLYTNIKYFGAATTNTSPSVLLNLYKDAAGETEPYADFRCHNGGKCVVEHCTFSNGMDDGIYLEGGNFIYAYNTLYQQGFTGGDATNIKAGTIADVCFNLYFSPNTNGLKLSNSGSRSPQANVIGYNNTIINAGWRRPTVKGGGIWYEAGVVAKTYNNLMVNDRFGLKTDGKADTASRADYNYYYGYWQNVINNFNAPTPGLFPNGAHDIKSTTPGDKNPLFVNYTLSTDTMSSAFNTEWDFHLEAGSPAIGAGTTKFTPHFSSTGITILGVTYTSPTPSTTIGAFSSTSTDVKNALAPTLVIHPNPVSDQLNIQLESIHSKTTITIYTSNGKPVYSTLLDGTQNADNVTIPISGLSKGIYFLNISNEEGNVTNKFIKE